MARPFICIRFGLVDQGALFPVSLFHLQSTKVGGSGFPRSWERYVAIHWKGRG
ncbi:hypothetical protein SERLA73DRAFT_188897 [Serpula lacrymans var. lacrymans S7.3]|uniref:Uncharacterized protein n=1 Tax=Serpula lacrymans var. lacrymans (strain S7.3) TaxID=936435 RepID=F8QCC5_SERL3|nr:hypothetical protein SERLA73DRAFT_188897 [Serpula lacrymans var. lacrymans S7.3]